MTFSGEMNPLSTPPRQPTRRLFFALCPAPLQRNALYQLARQYCGQCGGRIIPEANLHLTLLFLGEVEPHLLPGLLHAVDGIRIAPFNFTLRQFGCWQHNRIAYLAPAKGVPILRQLHMLLQQAASGVGVRSDGRHFKPHVTLLRNIKSWVAVQDVAPIRWQVETFHLMESITAERGVHYRSLKEWPCSLTPLIKPAF